eukprot:8172309-Pyramimonas_sp.AAC.1
MRPSLEVDASPQCNHPTSTGLSKFRDRPVKKYRQTQVQVDSNLTFPRFWSSWGTLGLQILRSYAARRNRHRKESPPEPQTPSVCAT